MNMQDVHQRNGSLYVFIGPGSGFHRGDIVRVAITPLTPGSAGIDVVTTKRLTADNGALMFYMDRWWGYRLAEQVNIRVLPYAPLSESIIQSLGPCGPSETLRCQTGVPGPLKAFVSPRACKRPCTDSARVTRFGIDVGRIIPLKIPPLKYHVSIRNTQ